MQIWIPPFQNTTWSRVSGKDNPSAQRCLNVVLTSETLAPHSNNIGPTLLVSLLGILVWIEDFKANGRHRQSPQITDPRTLLGACRSKDGCIIVTISTEITQSFSRRIFFCHIKIFANRVDILKDLAAVKVMSGWCVFNPWSAKYFYIDHGGKLFFNLKLSWMS